MCGVIIGVTEDGTLVVAVAALRSRTENRDVSTGLRTRTSARWLARPFLCLLAHPLLSSWESKRFDARASGCPEPWWLVGRDVVMRLLSVTPDTAENRVDHELLNPIEKWDLRNRVVYPPIEETKKYYAEREEECTRIQPPFVVHSRQQIRVRGGRGTETMGRFMIDANFCFALHCFALLCFLFH